MIGVAQESGVAFVSQLQISEAVPAEIPGIAQVKIPAKDELFGQAYERAVVWAESNAADLVSGIEESTRNMIAADIADSLANGGSLEMLVETLQENYAFSKKRAKLIARTEIRNANQHGALEGMRAAQKIGIKIKKYWSAVLDPCADCKENEDVSPIALDEYFPSGDLAPSAHPHCRCSLISEIDESSEKEVAGESVE